MRFLGVVEVRAKQPILVTSPAPAAAAGTTRSQIL